MKAKPLSLRDDSRSQLIAAATEIFLRDGFRAARVQDIARQAKVRISAISYYFDGKEGLYREVLAHHAELAVRQIPLQPEGIELPLRARFQFAVHALVQRMLDPRSPSRIAPLLVREMVNPTQALDELIRRFTLPQAQKFEALLCEVLGPAVPPMARQRALISIFGQSVIFLTGRPLLTQLAPDLLDDATVVESTARHIAEFSWGGLQALRAQWESSAPTQAEAPLRSAS